MNPVCTPLGDDFGIVMVIVDVKPLLMSVVLNFTANGSVEPASFQLGVGASDQPVSTTVGDVPAGATTVVMAGTTPNATVPFVGTHGSLPAAAADFDHDRW